MKKKTIKGIITLLTAVILVGAIALSFITCDDGDKNTGGGGNTGRQPCNNSTLCSEKNRQSADNFYRAYNNECNNYGCNIPTREQHRALAGNARDAKMRSFGIVPVHTEGFACYTDSQYQAGYNAAKSKLDELHR